MTPAGATLRRVAGWLPSRIFGLVVAIRNRRYDRPGAAWNAGAPVVSVGNLAVGGTGKTPMVIWLCSALVAEGRRPAVLTRGYGGTAGAGPLWVSRGSGPEVGPELGGDEPVLIARTLPEVPVVAGSDRRAGAQAAVAAGADVLVLDDGFQHRRIARDLDVVLVDAEDPFAGGDLVPAGDLREPPSALARAHVVVLTGLAPADDPRRARDAVARWTRSAVVVAAGREPLGFRNARGAKCSAPRRALAFCGIARPERFLSDLRSLAVEIADFRSFPDHHPYRPGELAELARAASSYDAVLVTTEKDLVRLARRDAGGVPDGLVILAIGTRLHEPEVLLDRVRGVLRGSDG